MELHRWCGQASTSQNKSPRQVLVLQSVSTATSMRAAASLFVAGQTRLGRHVGLCQHCKLSITLGRPRWCSLVLKASGKTYILAGEQAELR